MVSKKALASNPGNVLLDLVVLVVVVGVIIQGGVLVGLGDGRGVTVSLCHYTGECW